MFNVHKNQQSRQTGSRNLMGPKTLPTIWGTYMKLVTKYQISAINSCWEKCDEKWPYMFNVYKNQQSRQTGSRNLMGPKMLPTIWGTYMKLWPNIRPLPSTVTEKSVTKNILDGRKDGQTDRGKTVYSPLPSGSGGIKTKIFYMTIQWTFLPSLVQICFVVSEKRWKCEIPIGSNVKLSRVMVAILNFRSANDSQI